MGFLGIEPARAWIAMTRNSRAGNLEERLVQFAIAVVTLVGQLPQNCQAKHIARQILRSGTAAPRPIMAKRAPRKAEQILSIS
jgi:hypothetical protein